jgi:hypothetical protein
MSTDRVAAIAVLVVLTAAFVDTFSRPASPLTWLQRGIQLVGVIFLVGALSACGGSDDEPTPDTPAPRPPACTASGACT